MAISIDTKSSFLPSVMVAAAFCMQLVVATQFYFYGVIPT